jgi:hypothetical protein
MWGAARDRSAAGPDRRRLYAGGAMLLGGPGWRFFFFPHQPLGQRKKFLPALPAAQGEEAFHQPQTNRRGLIGFRKGKLWRHLDATHC